MHQNRISRVISDIDKDSNLWHSSLYDGRVTHKALPVLGM